MQYLKRAGKIASIFLAVILLLNFLPGMTVEASSDARVTIIGAEDWDYKLRIGKYNINDTVILNNEKPTFLISGCKIVGETKDNIELEIIDIADGAVLTFIAPESGRKSGVFKMSDFSKYINSTLKIDNVEKLYLEKNNNTWKLTIGDKDSRPVFHLYDHTKSWNEELKYKNSGSEPFVLNLENYTLKRKNDNFIVRHNFSRNSVMAQAGVGGIVFDPEEITFRTYETRLAKDSSLREITVTRTPPETIVGSTIRFGSNSDDGNNLATVSRVDPENKIIYITPFDSTNANSHEKGQWLRSFYNTTSSHVIDNEYPVLYLSHYDWTLDHDFMIKLLDKISDEDPTGLFTEIEINPASSGSIGYGLSDVTYSYDGANFTGGLIGDLLISMELDFLGEKTKVGPVRIDYANYSGVDSLSDEILRINTYKKEAWRFYFNPDIFKDFASIGRDDLKKPFPLTFRLYFDKEFKLIGGNIKLKLPSKAAIPVGGIVGVTALGGGYSRPATFEVDSTLADYYLTKLINRSFWQVDAEVVLSMDEGYLQIGGGYRGAGDLTVWDRLRLGSAGATIAWDKYKGKRFEGIEFNGKAGIEVKKIDIVLKMEFKVKNYIKNSKTKLYVGGKGKVSGEAYGVELGSASASLNSKRVKFTVKALCFKKSVAIKWEDMPKSLAMRSYILAANDTVSGAVYGNASVSDAVYGNVGPKTPVIASFTPYLNNQGVDSFITDEGYTVVLCPEAKLIPQSVKRNFSTNIMLAMAGISRTATENAETQTVLTLDEYYSETMISIKYTGSTPDVTVQTPQGAIMPVVITDSEEGTAEEGKLYGIDFESDVETGTRQMLISIENAMAGDYLVTASSNTIDEMSMYEIIPVPEIVSSEAILTGNMVNLNWELDKNIPYTKYHLTLERMENGETVEEIPLFADAGDEESDEIEQHYLESNYLIINGTQISTKLKLPNNLMSGEYRFLLEPVITEQDGQPLEEILTGDIIETNTFTYIETPVVLPPTNVLVRSIGNGIIRAEWDYMDSVDHWHVSVSDAVYSIGGVSISKDDLLQDVNMYQIGPVKRVYLDIGGPDNTFATRNIAAMEYGKTYTFEVRAVKDKDASSYVAMPVFNALGGYIDMNVIVANQHDGIHVYRSAVTIAQAALIEPKEIKFEVQLLDEEKPKPVFTASLYEKEPGSIGYDVETDTETLRERTLGSITLRANVLDKIKLIPDIPVKKMGISITNDRGEDIISIPPITLTDISDQTNYIQYLSNNFSELTAEKRVRIADILSAGVIEFFSNEVSINVKNYIDSIGSFVPGRYMVSLTAYNENDDITETSFTINLNHLKPVLIVDKIVNSGNPNEYTISGQAFGAKTIESNNQTTAVDEWGYFKITASQSGDLMTLRITDEFGDMNEISISFDAAAPNSSGGGGGSHSHSHTTSGTEKTSKQVDADSGGKVSCGGATVEIPGNTLPGDAEISIKKLRPDDVSPIVTKDMQVKLGSDIYEIDTTGDYNFGDKTITIKIAYNPDDIAEGEQPVIHYYNEEASEWVALETTVEQDDDGNWYAIVQVNHLTKFAVYSMAVEPATETTAKKQVITLTLGQTAVTVDGKPYTLEVKPYLDTEANRTMVPVRFISETLGFQVEWVAEKNQVVIKDSGKKIVLTIGLKIVLVDGAKKIIDCEPRVFSSGRTFVPLRFISETLGAGVDYNSTTKQITIVR